ncbi:hypothetical protein ACA910_005019 [Epithemia clementina (nom. ined.)]
MATFFRRLGARPLAKTGVLVGTGVIGGAFLTEYRSEQKNGTENSLPREYDWGKIDHYWNARPVSTVKRLVSILYELGPVGVYYVKDFVLFKPESPDAAIALEVKHAAGLRDALTNLGPAFVKAGQQLSIRPDLVPPSVLKELQKLCDSVRPISDEAAMEVIRQELAIDEVDKVFDEIKLVASASLGQVYKAKLRSTGDEVAVKVQRPNMRRSFSLDLFLLQKIGVLVDVFTSTFTNQPPFHKPLYESFAAGSYGELDYCKEAANQKLFKKELEARKCSVTIPAVFDHQTTERVLTTGWIDGIKLADSPRDLIRELIPVGVELFLTQLLDMGTFHADPHPGNLLVDKNGKLCLLDFGLCAKVDER